MHGILRRDDHEGRRDANPRKEVEKQGGKNHQGLLARPGAPVLARQMACGNGQSQRRTMPTVQSNHPSETKVSARFLAIVGSSTEASSTAATASSNALSGSVTRTTGLPSQSNSA